MKQPSAYLVTGGNRGIGLAFARKLFERGDSVVATARHPEKARELAKLSVRVEPLELADDRSIGRFARGLAGEPVDVLINNAGVGEAGPGLARLSMRDLEHAYRV